MSCRAAVPKTLTGLAISLLGELRNVIVSQRCINVVEREDLVAECLLTSLPSGQGASHDDSAKFQEDFEELFLCFFVALRGQLSNTLSALEEM